MKTMVITFFDIEDIVHFEFIPQGQSTKLMWKYRSSYMKLCIEIDLNFASIGFSTTTMFQLTRHSLSHSFWAKNQLVKCNTHPIPDLAPNDLWLFPQIKSALKE
jgi:hypothetical protein